MSDEKTSHMRWRQPEKAKFYQRHKDTKEKVCEIDFQVIWDPFKSAAVP